MAVIVSKLPINRSSAPSDPFPPAELPDEGLARPVVAGVVATICFLAAAVLFSTLAACFVNKQHRRKLKRKPGQSPSLLNLSVINIASLSDHGWITEWAYRADGSPGPESIK